jgi:ribosomal-protein-alanine N-acetyltransferase
MKPKELAALHARAYKHGRPWDAKEFDLLLKEDPVFLIGGKVGFALGRAVAGEAELLMIAVEPNQQGIGHGATLLAAFEYASVKSEAEVAFLEVSEDNATAAALYESAGYRQVGRRKAYYKRKDGKVDALILKKPLKLA